MYRTLIFTLPHFREFTSGLPQPQITDSQALKIPTGEWAHTSCDKNIDFFMESVDVRHIRMSLFSQNQ